MCRKRNNRSIIVFDRIEQRIDGVMMIGGIRLGAYSAAAEVKMEMKSCKVYQSQAWGEFVV